MRFGIIQHLIRCGKESTARSTRSCMSCVPATPPLLSCTRTATVDNVVVIVVGAGAAHSFFLVYLLPCVGRFCLC